MTVSATTIAVVGCGAIAELYHLPALMRHPATRNAFFLVEPNEKRRAEMAAKYKVEAFESIDALPDSVQGAIVATPPATHFPLCKTLLQREVDVLCEKPLTEDTQQAEELVEIARKHQRILAVNQTRRFFPTYQKIRELIATGELGQLRRIVYHDGVEFDWPAASPHHFSPGAKGAWSDTGVHLLDSVIFWLSAKPKVVASLNDSFGGPEAMATVFLQHVECEIEIKVSRLGRLSNRFVIEGSNAKIDAGAEDWSAVIVEYSDGRKRKFHCPGKYEKYIDFAHPLIDDFVTAIQTRRQPMVSGADTLSTIELLAEAYDRATQYDTPWNDHWRAQAEEVAI